MRVAEVVGVAGDADGCFDRLRPRPAPEVVRPEGAAVIACEDECLRVSAGAGDVRGDMRGQFVDDGRRH